MKNLIFALAISAFTISAVSAQVGIKAGVNFATMAEEGKDVSRDDIENHAIGGAVLGLTYDMNLSDIITIQPELLFSQSGGSNTYDVLGTITKTKYKINYLELPVLAKVTFGPVYLAAGPWIGYALSGKYNSKTTFNEDVLFETDRKYTFDDQDDTKRINYGMIGGLGVRFGKAVLDVRYNYGFNNLLDDDADNTNDNKPVLQTRGIALTLGITL